MIIIIKKKKSTIEITKEAKITKEIEAIEMITEKEIEIERDKEMIQKRNISLDKKIIEMIDFQKEKKEATLMKDLIMMIINLTIQRQGIRI